MKNIMLANLYKGVYLIFAIESIIILIGIISDKVSYGIDVQTPIMAIIIFVTLIFFTIARVLLIKIESEVQKGWALVLTIGMFMLCFYYLLEDNFKII